MSNENLQCRSTSIPYPFFFFFYFSAPGLSYSTQDLHCIFIASYRSLIVVHGLSLVVVHGLSSSIACGILVP